MFVCICNAITDRQIQETVAAGASTLGDLQAQLGVATCCGCCSDLASSFLNSTSQNQITAGINVQSCCFQADSIILSMPSERFRRHCFVLHIQANRSKP